MYDLTSFQMALLRAILKLGEPTGSQLIDEVGQYPGDARSPAAYYRNLKKLSDTGLVTTVGMAEDKRSNVYSLTEAGERKLQKIQDFWRVV